MKNNILKISMISFFICFCSFAYAQDAITNEVKIQELQREVKELKQLIGNSNSNLSTISNKKEAPVSKNYAVGRNGKLFAVINPKENTVEVLSQKEGKIVSENQILVDVIDGIYNIQYIYRAQNVEIYENNIVYLASNCDSSFLRVLDLKGNQIKEVKFSGQASSFSYDPSSKTIFVAGNNAEGFDFISIDASKGFENLSFNGASVMHYEKPKKADVIKRQDPYGIIVTVISFTIVFFSLILVVLVIMGSTSYLKRMEDKKAAKEAKGEVKESIVVGSDLSEDQYAAIAAAIYIYESELHDEENTVLTINKVAKVYSPWSSKLYNMNQYKM